MTAEMIATVLGSGGFGAVGAFGAYVLRARVASREADARVVEVVHVAAAAAAAMVVVDGLLLPILLIRLLL